ncbi:helix-turn-helix domain-containing protein [Lunatibacter salilacus]|uniref:helix-turn-helix domain-containing protein n=1 Tax=Lunatibacter salilacus TaxID=2483804 RepID=UPI00131E01F8|nr:helix-turn-helix domain-containing protein [Lunatibacter salilacus]
MIFSVKVDINRAFESLLKKSLKNFDIKYRIGEFGELELFTENREEIAELENILQEHGFKLVDNPKERIVQKIKNVIAEMIEMEEMPTSKISFYIAERVGMNYSYLSTFFSEQTHTSIENYIMLQKVEKAKQLLLQQYSLTDISFMLKYSSVAHLSGQFKKMTGLTPTAFKKIIALKRENS